MAFVPTTDLAEPIEWTRILWLVFALYWLVSALKRKVTKKRETIFQRLRYTVALLVGFWFLFSPDVQFYPWLDLRFLPATPLYGWLGVAITVAGAGVAFWARWHLGTNWSGVVTLKEGHELIRTGPYRTIRHPIYTGMLLALLGTALAVGEVRGLLAIALAWFSFYLKARREESFLAEEFGTAFAEHQRRTGMFLPKLSSASS
jgi:protein-S-isoprenylcysteine O-methyltransferase Ste14